MAQLFEELEKLEASENETPQSVINNDDNESCNNKKDEHEFKNE